jgi:hypothetical protein
VSPGQGVGISRGDAEARRGQWLTQRHGETEAQRGERENGWGHIIDAARGGKTVW